MASLPQNEWSDWIDTETLDDKGIETTITADEEARAALARRLSVDAINALSATLGVRPSVGGVVEVTGRFTANITQTCVVSGDPIDTTIEDNVEGWFADREKTLSFAKARQERDTKKGHVEVEMLDEREAPEEMVNGHIDLGELVTQHLSLAINPYPHKEGVSFESGDDQPMKRAENPFDALKALKK